MYEIGAGMCVLYAIEGLVVLGFVALILGILWKIVFYPMKTVHYINEWGNPRTKRVPDTDYHYKPEELWEPPTYWKAALEQAEKDWAPKAKE